MKIYYYCSYKGSPVGFRIGYIDLENNDQASDFCDLSDQKIDPFIRRCLETGLVRSAFGRIPTESGEFSSFFLLKKKLKGKKQDVDYYMNIAITCEKWKEFHDFMQDGMTETNLASAILDSIEINTNDKLFCYQVNRKKLDKVMKTAFGDICSCNSDFLEKVRHRKIIYFTLATATPDLELLKENLGIKEEELEFEKISGYEGIDNMFCYGKKKIIIAKNGHSLKWTILVVLALLLLMILIIAVMIIII